MNVAEMSFSLSGDLSPLAYIAWAAAGNPNVQVTLPTGCGDRCIARIST